jgi:biotin operon repressor
MQLERIVSYHKALADATRIKMLVLLAGGETNGQELAERLGVTPATITHHAAKLREAGLVRERRQKNTIYFMLNEADLKQKADAVWNLIARAKEGGVEMIEDRNVQLRESVLKNFFTSDGRLKSIPAQYKKKLIVLEYMVSKLEHGRKYTEKEINEYIKQYHEDYATIRREFIMHQYMYRENDVYEMNPQEMWTRWEKVR